MDIEAGGKEVSLEVVRELLIAISNSEPDDLPSSDDVPEAKLQISDNVPESFDRVNGSLTNGDAAEKYRSNLISISYTESPDVNMPPDALK